MKTKKLLSFAAFAAFIVMAVASGSDDKKTENNESNQVQQKWAYLEQKDEMSGKIIYFAECASINTIKFKFPYEEKGGSKFTLGIRNTNGVNDVYLHVSKGQFMSNFSGSEYCRVKFDEEEAVNYSYSSSKDGSSNFIFLSNGNKLISKLKTAKKLKIEAPFYQAGRQIIDFEIEGLVWDK